jgi:hypothetical protein
MLGRYERKARLSFPVPGRPRFWRPYCGGLGDVGVLGGNIGYIICGWSPVRDLRKSVIFDTSSSVSFWPSWLVPMT